MARKKLTSTVVIQRGDQKIDFFSLPKEEQIRIFTTLEMEYIKGKARRNGYEVESIRFIPNEG